ncbi:MAG TPA: DNA recombination protein RmuC [Patescibacteria group bacterium]|jgi:DNA recombination protein RmuC|nr:DNA recombination protein RmuC [Patescibacteria group bacterium]
MPNEFLILTTIIILGFIVLAYFLNKKLSEQKPDQALLEWLKNMQSTITNSSSQTVRTLQENTKQLNERLDTAARVIRDVEKEVGQMSEIGRNMRELQDFLKSPKLRGNIGEQVLKDLIAQMFPKSSFHLQYEFKSGEKVDAAIQTDAGILPIDSKFPMENYQKMVKATEKAEKEMSEKEFVRDIKKHIDAISKKYILPSEGTMDFALMYIPSESVYYEVVNQTDVLDYARKARVYMVSPSTLYAHLQTILLSFEGKKIESKSRELFTLLRSMQIDYEKIEENMSTLGKHINNAYSQFGNVLSGFSSLGQKLNSTKTLEGKKEIDKEEVNNE